MQTPEDAIEDAVVVLPRSAAGAAVPCRGEEVGDAFPVAIGELMAKAHGRPSKGNLRGHQVESAVM